MSEERNESEAGMSEEKLEAVARLLHGYRVLEQLPYPLHASPEAAQRMLTDILALGRAVDALAAECEALKKRCHTLATLADPWTPIDFLPGPEITLYYFEDAPQEWQDLSGHGGDEDFLIHVPAGQRASDLACKLREEVLGRYHVSTQDLPNGDEIIIHAHA